MGNARIFVVFIPYIFLAFLSFKSPKSSLTVRIRPAPAQSAQLQWPSDADSVTYSLSGGRLGDNLLAYFHAKWIAYKAKIPFIYNPFPGAEAFALQDLEHLLNKSERTYAVPYFPESKKLFEVDWDDPVFRAEIARCLAPKNPPTVLPLPSGKKKIAVHVRRGGSFDSSALWYEYPLKFPPDCYYIEQIQRVAALFPNELLYVYLFTDDLNPEKIAEKYSSALDDPRIEFDWRREMAPDLDDFYSIPMFDCLILCDSNFSIMASKLASFEVEILPKSYRKKKGAVKIERAEMILKL